ncbi:hypothetical protein [Pseudomonas amygdali]|uniref:Uncharacterized protein n=2 Tax=Pseudomonas amygdali pv. lachrymans TaxID=53707 RepID=A0AAD0M4L4_PSEAV|nr:hypothetical protein [Pseudomonas amygdali]AXH59645.1 hypothetical protein PLA107_030950 [Pseudomonas amygdali pv. lachrymans str. M301315]RMT06396.1 hypothetical protein ALP54_03559 [Pseudomonas amygdali pv. lachrymans]
MTNILQFPPKFDVHNFSTYREADMEEGMMVILNTYYEPENDDLLELRLDRGLLARFMAFMTVQCGGSVA